MDQPPPFPQSPQRTSFPWRRVIVPMIAIAIVIGAGIMFYDGYQPRAYTVDTPRAAKNLQEDRSAQTVTAVVEQFLDLTLPPDPIDYTRAALLLDEPLAQKVRADVSTIPQWYGIQDGPDHTQVLDVEAYQNAAGAVVGAYYGDVADRTYDADRVWDFGLRYHDGVGWRITSITVRQ